MFYRFDALVIRTEKNRTYAKLASTDQTKTLCYPSIGKFYTRGFVRRVRASLEASNASIMEADMHSFYSAIFLYVDLEAIRTTDLNYWIKLLSCITEANGGSRRGFYRFRLLVGMDKHCVNDISFTNNFCFFLNLPVNNELGIVQDGRHEFIIKCFKPSQNH